MSTRGLFSLPVLAAIAISLIVGLQPHSAHSADAEPLKVEVRPLERKAAVGDTVQYEVALKSARGAAANANKPMNLSVTFTYQDGRKRTSTIVVPAGKSKATSSFRVQSPGLTSIKTSHPELLDGGGAIIGVKGKKSRSSQPEREFPRRLNFSTGSRGLLLDSAPPPEPDAEPGMEQAVVLPAPVQPDDAQGEVSLFAPQRSILADGRDSIEIDIFLRTDRPTASDTIVTLSATRGELEDRIVVIPRGEPVASTRWRSVRGSTGSGEIKIESVSPRLARGDALTRTFAPPIHAISLRAAPPRITLLDTGGLVAELRDTVNDVAVETDRDLKLSLSIVEGSGDIRPLDVVFKTGESTARAEFRPKEWGQTTVSGQIPSRPSKQVEIQIGFAFIALSAALLGGTAGGALSWITKRARWWRIVIGTITGTALFFGFLFLGVDAFLNSVGDLDILNPYSVFFVSILGGWAGTAVLSRLLKQIGVNA